MRVSTARAVLMAGMLAGSAFSQHAVESMQMLMEKQMFYVSEGRVGQCKYWSLYLGGHDCQLQRKWPGEDTVTVRATVNFALMSSGYINGSGMAENGRRVSCLTGFAFVTQDTSCKLSIDSIAYAWDGGSQVRTASGTDGYLRIDAEGSLRVPSDMVLSKYKMVDHYGEQVLRKDTDVTISAFAFTREGIQRALALQKKAGSAR